MFGGSGVGVVSEVRLLCPGVPISFRQAASCESGQIFVYVRWRFSRCRESGIESSDGVFGGGKAKHAHNFLDEAGT